MPKYQRQKRSYKEQRGGEREGHCTSERLETKMAGGDEESYDICTMLMKELFTRTLLPVINLIGAIILLVFVYNVIIAFIDLDHNFFEYDKP